MGFFNKKPGNSNQDANKPDIDYLLVHKPDQLLTDLHTYLSELSDYGDKIERLSNPQTVFYFCQELEMEINNGGFNQYFNNSAGGFAHETAESLRLIGAMTTAGILQAAIDQFPGSNVPGDQSERQTVLGDIEESANETWEELDQRFLAYDDNLFELNLAYIRNNREMF